jgi:hypothetical protein
MGTYAAPSGYAAKLLVLLAAALFLRAHAAGAQEASTPCGTTPDGAPCKKTPDVDDAAGPGLRATEVLDDTPPRRRREDDGRPRTFPHLAPSPNHTHWYGWQIAIADGASLATAGTALAIGRSAYGVAMIGGAGWGLAPAVIHLFHGRETAAGASVGFRLLAPVGGFLAGYGYAATQGRGCFNDTQQACVKLGFIASGVVAVGAMFYDIASAKEPVARKATAVQWAPTFAVAPSRGREGGGIDAALGVVGSF